MSDTPMMLQYKEIKQQHRESILFFRMGDFYEMFFDDAEEVSRLLNLTLTQRQGTPMCGIPYHAVQNYLGRLLQFGKRIAICEQVEAPQKGKGITRREVVEIVSPGTVLQDSFLEGGANNYLQVFCKIGRELGMALLDFSTGEFAAASFEAPTLELRREVLQRELLLASSRELLLMEDLHDEFPDEFWRPAGGAALCNRIPSWCFQAESAQRKLCDFFRVHSLKGFGFAEFDEGGASALGAAWVVLEYLQQQQKYGGLLLHVQRLVPLRRSEELQLDSAALRNLEIFQNFQNGGHDFTLYRVLHDCQSALGSRCLQRWLRHPLKAAPAIQKRLDYVEFLLLHTQLRGYLRRQLAGLSDLERLCSRIATKKANARDLVALRNSLALFALIHQSLCQSPASLGSGSGPDAPDVLRGDQGRREETPDAWALLGALFAPLQEAEASLVRAGMPPPSPPRSILGIDLGIDSGVNLGTDSEQSWQKRLGALEELLQHSIAEDPPLVLHEGGIFSAGYSQELDELRTLLGDRREILNRYVAKEQEQLSGVKLKLKYNKIIGYYFELSKAQAGNVPPHFIRRQSLVNGERFSTEELGELEAKLSSADEQTLELERRLFDHFLGLVQPYVPLLLALGKVLGELDVLANFAEVSVRENYSKPEILCDISVPAESEVAGWPKGSKGSKGSKGPKEIARRAAGEIWIEGGRHPVVEHYLHGEPFVANNLSLDSQYFFALITGPNMAGKSTYLRQNALIVLLAQIGCFVPARRVRMHTVDRIFCRVGASDNLSRGESTFMVEMQETARILNEATHRSLVIMDEVGRGTSTRDGLAIAQAVCEYILGQLGCKTLFATHYHELTSLENAALQLLCLAVHDEDGQIRFLKHVQEGATASSYGIHVAALAGIPGWVTARAQEILEQEAPRQAGGKAQPGLGLSPQDSQGSQDTPPPGAQRGQEEGNSARPSVPSVSRVPKIPGVPGVPSMPKVPRTQPRSLQAQAASLLFSEADLLLDELRNLRREEEVWGRLSGAKALALLEEWAQKYL